MSSIAKAAPTRRQPLRMMSASTISPTDSGQLESWCRVRFFRWVWLFPAVFVCHVAEEAPRFSQWVVDTLGGHTSMTEFIRNHVAYVVVLGTLTALAAHRRTNATGFALMLWISAQQLWNFVFHLVTTLYFDTYSPGLVTAVLLYYPLYLLMAALALRGRVVTAKGLAVSLVAGGVALGLVAWVGFFRCGPVPFFSGG